MEKYVYPQSTTLENSDIYFGICTEKFMESTPHSHEFYEIFIITSGHIQHFINDTVTVVKQGDVCFIRKNDSHYFKLIGSDKIIFTNIGFSEEFCENLFTTFEFTNDLLNSDMPPICNLPQFENLHNDIINYTHSDLKLLVVNIISKIVSKTTENEPKTWIELLVFEMQKKENFSLGLNRMYELSNYSIEHVCRETKKYCGKTPSELINDIRLSYASKMLMCSDKKIIDIAFDCGYNNLSHFYHIFNKYFNISPQKYRKQYYKKIF